MPRIKFYKGNNNHLSYWRFLFFEVLRLEYPNKFSKTEWEDFREAKCKEFVNESQLDNFSKPEVVSFHLIGGLEYNCDNMDIYFGDYSGEYYKKEEIDTLRNNFTKPLKKTNWMDL